MIAARRPSASIALVVGVSAWALAVDPAIGQDSRLTRDLTASAELSGGYGAPAEAGDQTYAFALSLRLRYLDMAGIVVGGEVWPERTSRLIVGADLRPIFLGRFLLGASFRDRYADLLLDSIGLELGAAVHLAQGSRSGAGLMVGFGVDVPLLFFSSEGMDGLALRVGARYYNAQPNARLGPAQIGHEWQFYGGLVVRTAWALGAASWEPRRYRTR